MQTYSEHIERETVVEMCSVDNCYYKGVPVYRILIVTGPESMFKDHLCAIHVLNWLTNESIVH